MARASAQWPKVAVAHDHYAHQLAVRIPRWGVISTQSGKFIVPDVPIHTIIPLSPRIALVAVFPTA